jgi:predicted lipid-binding transport protein (Tim44 family)
VLLSITFLLLFLIWLGMNSEAFARAGGGKSSGSRSYSSGASSTRAPSSPAPAQQGQYQQAQPSVPPSGAGRSFFSGLAGGIVGGLLGGMLFRSLGFAGMGEGGSGFGFGDLLFIMVILGLIYFVVKRFRSRNTMQMSAAGAGPAPYSYPMPSPEPTFAPPQATDSAGVPVSEGLRHIRAMDPSFSERNFKDLAEDIFFKIQGAWTRRDLSGVRHLLTQEMLGIFGRDLEELIAKKQTNKLENIAVREVEIVEAGQERGEDYISVRIYANLLDYVVDEKNGQVVSGSSSDPVKFVEYWTFTRNVGEKNWVLAGIAQEAGR